MLRGSCGRRHIGHRCSEWPLPAKCSRGKYICNFVGAVYNVEHLSIVTEYAPFGSLEDAIQTRHIKTIPLQLKYKWFFDISRGLNYLHSKGQVHGDIKTSNVLIFSFDPTEETNAKLTDCGFKRTTDVLVTDASLCNGIENVQYIAPEVLKRDLYLTNADVFSFAMILFETLHWRHAFDKKQFPFEWTIAQFICDGKRPSFTIEIEEWIKDLIENCWNQSHFERYSSQTIVQLLNEHC